MPVRPGPIVPGRAGAPEMGVGGDGVSVAQAQGYSLAGFLVPLCKKELTTPAT